MTAGKRTISALAKEKLSQLYQLTADASKQILSPVFPPIFPLHLYRVLAYQRLIVMMQVCIFKAFPSFKSPKALWGDIQNAAQYHHSQPWDSFSLQMTDWTKCSNLSFANISAQSVAMCVIFVLTNLSCSSFLTISARETGCFQEVSKRQM